MGREDGRDGRATGSRRHGLPDVGQTAREPSAKGADTQVFEASDFQMHQPARGSMTTMKRMAPFCGTIALLAQVFVFQGCGSSNTGTTGTGGSAPEGTGGTTGTGGTGTAGFGQPACGNTMEGVAIAKGGTCTAADATAGTPTALCYKTCGPEKQGVKSETCPAGGGTYAEMTGCSFDPSKDFSCYKVPATVAD